MIGSSKPMASLSSGLLARKGQAKPAMRPQGFVGITHGHDDLGWNDMGDDVPMLAPAPQPVPPKPVVLRQIEALDEQIAQAAAPASVGPAPVAPEPAPAAPAPAPRAARKPPATWVKPKAAFTLRLDNDRHLRLRLASALTNRSAQLIVCEALDAFLESLTEVEALARQVIPAKDHG
jgi:lysophospholipase L1-like esterase